jgi:hypothetical protein
MTDRPIDPAFVPVRMSFGEFMMLGGGDLMGCRYEDNSGETGPDRPIVAWLPAAVAAMSEEQRIALAVALLKGTGRHIYADGGRD